MSRPRAPVLALAIGASILAVSTAATLIVMADAPPLAVAFYRLLYATVLLLPFALWRAREDLRNLKPGEWAGLFLVGAVLAVHFASWITSLDLTSVAASVVLVTLHPVFVAFASHRLFGEGVGTRGYVGIGVALAGGLLITAADASAGTNPLVGDLLALLGAAAAAVYFLAGRGFRKRLGLLAYVVPVYASCTLVLGVMLWALQPPYGGAFTGYSWQTHVIFLALALVPMILGHTVLNWALKYVPAPVIATTILGEPIGASLLAFLVLDEAPPVATLVGGGLVLAGITLVALAGATTPREAAPAG